MPEPAGALQPRRPSAGEKAYTGHPISLDFKDGDLQDIFRLFADISGMNVVVNPGVSGKVTLKLNEVPWDQALDLILKANGLGYTVEGNVIRIARLTDLQKEEQDRRKLAEEKALAGDLGTPHHAHLLRQGQRALGRDQARPAPSRPAAASTWTSRTNTMIIKDLPALPRQVARADRRARPAHAAGGDRGPHRGHQPQLHARPRHPVGLPEPADRRSSATPPARAFPQRGHPERQRRARRTGGMPRPTRAGPAADGRHRPGATAATP